jgi:hypothetical protein
VRELRAALDAAATALREHRPNLPALRSRGTLHTFE